MKTLVAPGGVRYPRISLLVAGTAMPGLISAEVTSNSHYQADAFHAEIALNAEGGRDLIWWGADARVGELYDIHFTLDGLNQSMIIGACDKIEIQPVTGLVTITGRDLTSRFIDNRIQQAFKNQTSSQIATTLAKKRGLTPVVTATKTLTTRYYENDHDRVSHDDFSHTGTEWDLLTFLAQREAFDVYVKGIELHFQPETPPTAEPWGVHWNADDTVSDVMDLQLDRSLTLAKDVIVQVRSWQSSKGKGFTKSAPAVSQTVKTGSAQRFTFTFPNLTPDQAQDRANKLREEITRHERNIRFTIPGELALSPRDTLQLVGCGGWDQTYFASNIVRRIDVESGFTETVSAKNHSPESQVINP